MNVKKIKINNINEIRNELLNIASHYNDLRHFEVIQIYLNNKPYIKIKNIGEYTLLEFSDIINKRDIKAVSDIIEEFIYTTTGMLHMIIMEGNERMLHIIHEPSFKKLNIIREMGISDELIDNVIDIINNIIKDYDFSKFKDIVELRYSTSKNKITKLFGNTKNIDIRHDNEFLYMYLKEKFDREEIKYIYSIFEKDYKFIYIDKLNSIDEQMKAIDLLEEAKNHNVKIKFNDSIEFRKNFRNKSNIDIIISEKDEKANDLIRNMIETKPNIAGIYYYTEQPLLIFRKRPDPIIDEYLRDLAKSKPDIFRWFMNILVNIRNRKEITKGIIRFSIDNICRS